MGGFARRTAAALAATALLLTACGKSSSHSSTSRTTTPRATVPATAPTTTQATDPYAVPAKMDAAYLNKVFLALEHVNGDAARLIVAARQLVPDAAVRLRAIYAEDDFQTHVTDWLDLIHGGLDDLQPVPGDLVTTVRRIVSQRLSCVFVEVARDYSRVRRSPAPTSVEFVAMRPADPARDNGKLNPTPWAITGEGFNRDGSTPSDPCRS